MQINNFRYTLTPRPFPTVTHFGTWGLVVDSDIIKHVTLWLNLLKGYWAPGGWKSPFSIDLRHRSYNSVSTNVLHCDIVCRATLATLSLYGVRYRLTHRGVDELRQRNWGPRCRTLAIRTPLQSVKRGAFTCNCRLTMLTSTTSSVRYAQPGFVWLCHWVANLHVCPKCCSDLGLCMN